MHHRVARINSVVHLARLLHIILFHFVTIISCLFTSHHPSVLHFPLYAKDFPLPFHHRL